MLIFCCWCSQKITILKWFFVHMEIFLIEIYKCMSALCSQQWSSSEAMWLKSVKSMHMTLTYPWYICTQNIHTSNWVIFTRNANCIKYKYVFLKIYFSVVLFWIKKHYTFLSGASVKFTLCIDKKYIIIIIVWASSLVVHIVSDHLNIHHSTVGFGFK